MCLAICAIFRNEATYLREWIEFHRIAGVERFYLYQNRSEDDWQPVVEPYIDAGVVEVTDWPVSPPCQLQAYQHFIDRHKGKAWWVAFIDCDEFLFSPSHQTIMDALARVSRPEWGAVGANWMCFGASGRKRRTKGLVTERFTLRPADNFGSNLHVKSIVRMDRVKSAGPNPHQFIVKGGTFHESGREILGPLSTLATHGWLRINHYHTKSRQEYIRRIARGKADGAAMRSPDEFRLYQSTAIDDRVMSRFLPALKQRLAGAGVEAAPAEIMPGWEADPRSVTLERKNTFALHACKPLSPGSETGLIGTKNLGNVRFSFEILTEPGAVFLAKIHQREQRNQASDSYHLMGNGAHSCVARHNHVLATFPMRTGVWESVAMTYQQGTLCLELNGKVRLRIQDHRLPAGYCFLGIKAGAVRARNLAVTAPGSDEMPASVFVPPHDLLYDSRGAVQPQVSIVTTVYDRVACLERCIQSVQALRFGKYEHIVVADAPPVAVIRRIHSLMKRYDDGRHRLRLAVLHSRTNDWGISPAAAGLSLSSGRYVCFLSDDNGYTPDHFGKLVATLDTDPEIGFAYSSCYFDGRGILDAAQPDYSRIDLGQPLFRRELFHRYLGGTLPFSECAWDWRMIERLLQNGVRWKHIEDVTFIFRLARYPHLMARPVVNKTAGECSRYRR